MKKFFITVLALICMACLTAAACSNTYYVITFKTDAGVTIVAEDGQLKSGYEVKKGYEVRFTLEIAENATGEATVKANETELTANENGVYSFKMKEDTVIEVTGVYVSGDCDVAFGVEVDVADEEGNVSYTTVTSDWVKFLNADGETIEKLSIASGETISFTIKTSVYYDGYEYSVAAGSSVLRADENGVYNYTVTGDVTISVKGLPTEFEDSFVSLADGGEGTADDPFKIRKPIDLYVMADRIADPWYSNGFYQTAYYSLENDIDMKGDQLFVIGDGTTDSSLFAGVFDGNGHTISNYYMTNALIEQADHTTVYLQYVGLFGNMLAAASSNAGVYNLNLKDFEMTVNGALVGAQVFAGGLIGFGIGVNISNCSVSGVMNVDGDSGYFGYAGGLIGFQQSAYIDGDMRYYSMVQSSSSNVNVNCGSGYIFAAGGIAGYLYSYEERTTASILNCYSTGNVNGAMRAGGIVGQINAYSSVKNSYATGNIEAVSNIANSAGMEEYARAYAGGIAGYAEYDSIISDSFFTGKTYVYAVTGARFAFNDGLVAATEKAGAVSIYNGSALVLNSYSNDASEYCTGNVNINDNFIKSTLGWNMADWTFSGNGRPDVNRHEASKNFKITVISGGEKKAELEIENFYISMSYWYSLYDMTDGEDGLSEFLGTGNRTYGYYFDGELKNKVPFGYVPTDDITIYTDYVNYGEVVGDYYLAGKNGAHITLTDDGYIIYRDGALSCTSTYVYNGEYLILYNTFLAILADEDYDFYTFKAEVENGVMTVYDLEVYPVGSELKALKKSENLKYGAYYDEAGFRYTFNEDGTGVMGGIGDTAGTSFTYTVKDGVLTLVRSGATFTGVVNAEGVIVSLADSALTRFDAYKGVWEKSAGSHRQYEFDGINKWTYKYLGYDNLGRECVLDTASGEYTVNEDGTLTLDDGTAVRFEKGVLKIGTETYYAQYSFVGTWVYATEKMPVNLTFKGIGADGIGSAVIDYGSDYGTLDVTYAAVVSDNGTAYITIYYYYNEYGLLTFNTVNKTLTGSIFIAKDNVVVSGARFCLQDDFKGVWSSEELKEAEGITTIEFNGSGNYNLEGTADYMPVRGNVKINGKSVGVYKLENATLKGSFTYGGKTYDIEFNEAEGVAEVTVDGITYKLEKNT